MHCFRLACALQTTVLRDPEVGLMLCAERDSLWQQHRVIVQQFRASIRNLVALVDNSASDLSFNLAHRRIRATRRACEAARDALEHHQAEHGCLNLSEALDHHIDGHQC